MELLDLLNTTIINEEKNFKNPTNEIEWKISEIWSKVLNLNDISIDADFFKLGGNSLKMIRVHSLINIHFPSIITVQDLFDHRTIEELGKVITEKYGLVNKESIRTMKKIEF
ncbi:phosphopantetheine-binding protein [Paenibacillus gorillae]|uniref:phosphopantetheine-binding protein n=1 Tax=Paenibacillus gorillae TaxID=1243662 RepID=UPI00138B1595|nr:phosphopantetheine-binding protein [Paenibacillus gorillae]